ncbi:MAG TPA: A/G-specific adenine glycosylase [Bryobacteraceae bacterium]|nr:A/G-specific adenine glycosylase [Bryobacteraceae bacterium]
MLSRTMGIWRSERRVGSEADLAAIRRKLTRWYARNARDLPWRRTRDPYRIWISEIMLQQTRVTAVVPYYERFLARFPDAASLARASETEVLRHWSGLGYYSRARNLRLAAQTIAAASRFPRDYDGLLALPGVGRYTAAAIASIAYDLPHAVVDGNVRRVLARLANDGAADAQALADRLLDRQRPGRWNQALMELGALICAPAEPRCQACPIVRECAANRAGSQAHLPPPRPRPETVRLERTLLLIRRRKSILLAPSSRVKGFWDLPDAFEGAQIGSRIGSFRHSILHRQYRFHVFEGFARTALPPMRWFAPGALEAIPLSATAKKALRCFTERKAGRP